MVGHRTSFTPTVMDHESHTTGIHLQRVCFSSWQRTTPANVGRCDSVEACGRSYSSGLREGSHSLLASCLQCWRMISVGMTPR